MMKPKRLVFAGGGTRCLVFLPALLQLEEEGILSDVEAWVGTSAGALLAALMAVARSASRVKDIFQKIDFSRFRDFNVSNMVQFMDVWGLDDGEALMLEIERVLDLAHSGASQWTLEKIPNLVLAVADLTDHVLVKVSAANFPSLRISEAIRASMSFPIFYRPFLHPTTGHVWIDGGLCANFMWNELSDQEKRESLGFSFERPCSQGGPETFTEYLQAMLRFDDPHRTRELKATWSSHILWFPLPPYPVWYVRFQSEDFEMLNELAHQAVENWRLFTRSHSETSKILTSHEDRCIPLPTSPRNHTGGMLGIPQSSCQPLHLAPSRDLQSYRPLPSRRWSF